MRQGPSVCASVATLIVDEMGGKDSAYGDAWPIARSRISCTAMRIFSSCAGSLSDGRSANTPLLCEKKRCHRSVLKSSEQLVPGGHTMPPTKALDDALLN